MNIYKYQLYFHVLDYSMYSLKKAYLAYIHCSIKAHAGHQPVLNADVWKPNLWRRYYNILNSVIHVRFPCQVIIYPFLTTTWHSTTTRLLLQYHCYSSILTILIYLIANWPMSTAKALRKSNCAYSLQSAVLQLVSIFRFNSALYTGSLNRIVFLSKNRYDF